MADRMSRTVTSSSSTADSKRSTTGRLRGQTDRALQAQSHGEQTLDDGVVQVPRNAVAILEQREFRDPCVQSGVFDRDTGGRGERHDQLLVDIGERVTTRLVAQVEVAEDLARYDDRHAEERSSSADGSAGTRSCRDARAGPGGGAVEGRR